MNSNLIESISKVCQILSKHSVQYLIVGGASVAFYGYYRLSTAPTGLHGEKFDFDFWYNPTYKNYFKLLIALEELGQDVSEFKDEQTPDPYKSFFRFELEIATIDFLPSVPGLSKFTNCYKKKELASFDGVDIPIISYEDLIISKKEIGRQKDVEDINQLNLRRNKPQDGKEPSN
jgi:predicted nucleotidyltransferase